MEIHEDELIQITLPDVDNACNIIPMSVDMKKKEFVIRESSKNIIKDFKSTMGLKEMDDEKEVSEAVKLINNIGYRVLKVKKSFPYVKDKQYTGHTIPLILNGLVVSVDNLSLEMREDIFVQNFNVIWGLFLNRNNLGLKIEFIYLMINSIPNIDTQPCSNILCVTLHPSIQEEACDLIMKFVDKFFNVVSPK